ncbi:unnamed protein product [Pleuronectes platessa]|uniref:Uncharacterized protein n=1 Tax=Pleuronectes platessa TaxID=8262 RepID=A0A9N7Z174_PLEPL|nr:unnamed protein product [Pleuronectes platessa]
MQCKGSSSKVEVWGEGGRVGQGCVALGSLQLDNKRNALMYRDMLTLRPFVHQLRKHVTSLPEVDALLTPIPERSEATGGAGGTITGRELTGLSCLFAPKRFNSPCSCKLHRVSICF